MIPDDWGRPDGRATRVVVSPFRPTSRIDGREQHYHVEVTRRWCRLTSDDRYVTLPLTTSNYSSKNRVLFLII